MPGEKRAGSKMSFEIQEEGWCGIHLASLSV